jgi:sugar/nucleoside kinase (ribokinase family)
VAIPDLVTAGEAFEDFIFAGLPRLPRTGEELKTPTMVRAPGGGAIITAVAAARLGLRCRTLVAIGNDAEQRVARTGVRFRRPGELPAMTVALSTPRDRAFATFGVNDRPSRGRRAVRGASARHVHFALQPSRCRRWIPIVESLRRRGVSTSWDFGWSEPLARDRSLARLAAAVDILFLNAAESRLYRAIKGRTTIIKLGARGARMEREGSRRVERAPAPRVRVVDTTGAGDVFDGAFLFAFLRGRPPGEWLRIANREAARSTRSIGGVA